MRRTISALEAEIPKAKAADRQEHLSAERAWEESRASLGSLRAQIAELWQQMDKESPGIIDLFLDWTLQKDRPAQRAKAVKWEALTNRARIIEQHLGISTQAAIPEPQSNPYSNVPPSTWNYDRACERLQAANAQLAHLLSALGGDSARLERLEAVEARVLQRERDLATKLRLTFTPTDECPYCGQSLGANPRLDHIYPVSKGGLSVTTNLVFVCLPCNQQKSDLTLAAFLRAYTLDRSAVEARLARLGKNF